MSEHLIDAERENPMQDPNLPSLRFLHSGFHASARRHADRPALSLAGDSWTYAELDRVARQWAAALLRVSARPRRVGVLGHRSLVTYAGFLAALYAGAAAVPLNKKYPAARNQDIVERSGLDAVLSDDGAVAQLIPLLSALDETPPVLLPETDDVPYGLPSGTRVLTRRDIEGGSLLPEPVFGDPDDTAYLLFTSGSTGRPKGVPIAHAHVTSFLRGNSERYDFTPEDRFTNTFDQTFDLSVFDLFMAWGSGGCLVPMDGPDLRSPVDFVRERGITVWFSVPSVAVLQQRGGALAPGSMPTLRWSLFCGEALAASAAAAWQAAAPHSVLENLYGPTEATIACMAYRWDPLRSPGLSVNGVVPIGTPYPSMEADLFAEDGSVVPDGATGEICLKGPQVFEGYWRDPEQTRRSFHTRADGRWYRTGDLGRRAPDGAFLFLGRLDSQVKILGHRVETGEVEAHLRQQAGVDQAVVVAVPGEDDSTTVLAAILSGPDPDAYAIEKGLRDSLPPYMIPFSFHLVDDLPLNANGKVDRRALRDQVLSGELEPLPL
ncbi:amino acid adenylation domain-containing protein [Streptomyces caelestis]|uniref:amino acid adenylation domain-containing protein n=1 Tax=Streptomyces caelestis TaxID=36816 RepID=UPI0036FE284A